MLPFSTEMIRGLLVLCLIGTSLLSALYLRKRSMSFSAYLGWGLLALLVPLFGPFLIFLLRPGRRLM